MVCIMNFIHVQYRVINIAQAEEGNNTYELLLHFLRHGYYIYAAMPKHAITIVGY